ncbi:MAG: PDGLE domain-containing protein [Candidatus Magnetobacterium sp. LHC-1]|nr:cobalamin biosynthesis protein [Nitrospirota bacterium]
MVTSRKKLWTGLFILALLTPIGVILPRAFNAGDAWGEWGPETLEKLLGYVPDGVNRLSGLWNAPIPDYNLGGENASMAVQVISYTASGLIGILAISLVMYILSRFIAKNEK